MPGAAASAPKLPRRNAGQTVDQYLDVLVSKIEIELQRLATKQGRSPVITGARGGNAALGSLIGALATLGTVTDQTTT